jgi:hypothetical protein
MPAARLRPTSTHGSDLFWRPAQVAPCPWDEASAAVVGAAGVQVVRLELDPAAAAAAAAASASGGGGGHKTNMILSAVGGTAGSLAAHRLAPWMLLNGPTAAGHPTG